jgi:hypothetical protein
MRRPSSSAETSIDEDTANQLLADDFSVPASPKASYPKTMTFARPTSSAFDPQRHNSCMGSSQTSPIAPPPITRSQHSSRIISSEPETGHPTTNIPREHSTLPLLRPGSAVNSINSFYGNPFVDPIEPIDFTSIAEKGLSALLLNNRESSARPTRSKKKLVLFLLLTLIGLLTVILIPVGLRVVKRTSSHTTDSNNGLTSPDTHGPSALGIPQSAVGTVLDSTKWLDWTDFNVTYTGATVGGLSLVVWFHGAFDSQTIGIEQHLGRFRASKFKRSKTSFTVSV